MSSVEPPEEDDSSLAKLGGSMLERLAKSGPGSSSGSRASRGIPKRRIWWPLVTPSTLPGLALIGMISALSGTGIVYVLNSESALVADYKYSGGLVLGFVAFLLVYRISQQLLISRTCAAMERALHDWRTRVSEKVLRLSLSQSEQMTKGSLHDGLAKSYAQISQTIVPMVAGAEAGILSLFMLLYLLSISLIAGALTIFLAVVLAIGYINTSVSMREGMAAAEQADTKMFRLAEELVGGFKELKLHPKKQQLLRADLNDASLSVAKNRSTTAVIISRLITTANSTSFLLAATVVFVLPILDKGGEANLGRLVTAVLFMLGPLGAMVSSTQQFAMARFRISIIQKF